MNKYKSIFAGVLASVTILSFGGGIFAAPTVSAATEAEQQAQIAALLAQIAALQASMSGSSSSCYTFSTDLTLGSTSEGVRALQVFLNNKGYMIATAGPGSKGNETTYFGGLTRTALAKYQAAVGISPAAGYFGPITRAKVNADCTTTNPGTGTGTGTGSTGGALTGGEADLSNYDLRQEESTGNEGESKVEIFTAEFDVEDGDVRVERVDVTASSTSSTLETDPWNFFDKMYLLDGDGKTIASMDVDNRDDWDEDDDGVFQVSASGLSYVVREGEMAEITVAFDIADNIDTDDQDQEFEFYIESEGIRARDAAGIDQYTGDTTDEADFSFGAEENGDLNIQSSNADPDAAILVADDEDESDEYTVFAFDIENDEDVDSLITDLTIDATSSLGNVDNVIRSATLLACDDEFDGDVSATDIQFDDIDCQIDGDDEQTFKLMVTLARNASGTLIFDVDGTTDVEAEGVDSGDDSDVSGSATSETHTIALNGIAVVAVSTDSETIGQNNTVGQFEITFKVTAMDDDAYIANSADNTGTVGVTYEVFTSGATSTDSGSLNSSADLQSGYYLVNEGDTETFTLTVSIDANSVSGGIFYVGLDKILFADSTTTTGATTFEVDEDDEDFKAGPETILN